VVLVVEIQVFQPNIAEILLNIVITSTPKIVLPKKLLEELAIRHTLVLIVQTPTV